VTLVGTPVGSWESNRNSNKLGRTRSEGWRSGGCGMHGVDRSSQRPSPGAGEEGVAAKSRARRRTLRSSRSSTRPMWVLHGETGILVVGSLTPRFPSVKGPLWVCCSSANLTAPNCSAILSGRGRQDDFELG
jgi:hypothetical protein